MKEQLIKIFLDFSMGKKEGIIFVKIALLSTILSSLIDSLLIGILKFSIAFPLFFLFLIGLLIIYSKNEISKNK